MAKVVYKYIFFNESKVNPVLCMFLIRISDIFHIVRSDLDETFYFSRCDIFVVLLCSVC